MNHSKGNWPLNIDFTAAIQNPSFSLADTELKLCQPQKNKQGRVMLWPGNFAVVYKLSNGQKCWAVRCFLKPVSDIQQRYIHISQHLSRNQSQYLVKFQFIEKGIKVKSNYYPILKMDWVEGIEIDSYINQHLANPTILNTLLQQVKQLQQDLRNVQIAHGDLQHGNILLTQSGQLKLVDYDGMYVPALQRNPPNEKGHRNYQLPTRSSQDFNAAIDDFSFDVIELSLAAIGKNPSLWNQFHTGNENLLFREDDFKDPDNSDVFKCVSQINNPNVQALYTQLVNRCKGIVPPTGTVLSQSPVPQWHLDRQQATKTKPTTTNATSSSQSPVPQWHLDRQQATKTKPTTTNATASRSSIKQDNGLFWIGGTFTSIVVAFLLPFHQIKFPYQVSAFLPSPSPSPTYSFNFPMKQGCGDSAPRKGETWYPVFVENSKGMLDDIKLKYCPKDDPQPKKNRKYNQGKSTSIQVASFRDRKKAEAFAERMRIEVKSGEVGDPSTH